MLIALPSLLAPARTQKKGFFEMTMHSYKGRDAKLRKLGFSSYREYLQSRLWKSIRLRVLHRDKNKCVCCDAEATEVHHRAYSQSALTGRSIASLVSVCRLCHKTAEWNGSRKTTLQEANRSIPTTTKLCHQCRKNPLGSKRINIKTNLCSRCRRDSRR